MSATPENPPAFPFQPFSLTGFARDTVSSQGMTLRDWFAGQALAGFIVSLGNTRNEHGYSDDACAYEAVRLSLVAADAMLAVRSTKGTP